MNIKAYNFPSIIDDYNNSLNQKLRERESIDENLDFWVPSEDIYESFKTFCEAQILNNKFNKNLVFICNFTEIYEKSLIENILKKFNTNFNYRYTSNLNSGFEVEITLKENSTLDSNEKKLKIKKNFTNSNNFIVDKLLDFTHDDIFDYSNYNSNEHYEKPVTNIGKISIKRSFYSFSINFEFDDDIKLVDCKFYLLKDYNLDSAVIEKIRKIINKSIDLSIGKPLREIQEHSALNTMHYFLKDENLNKYKIGVFTIKNPCAEIFLNLQNVFLDLFLEICSPKSNFQRDYEIINEYFQKPPNAWINLSKEKKIEIVNNEISLILKNYHDKDTLFEAIDIKKNLRGFQIRIVVEFSIDPINLTDRSFLMRRLEDKLNTKYNYHFDVIFNLKKDESVLRRMFDV